MTRCYVQVGAKQKPVTNLGWLMPFMWKVEHVLVEDVKTPECDVRMTADLSDGRKFVCEWADRVVCWDWLHSRRNLHGCPVDWMGDRRVIQAGQQGKCPDLI
jgi:hypothetical protein